MQNLRLLVLRHGETECNVSGLIQGQTHGCLSERGRTQAQEVARRLMGESLDAVWCSDLQRALDTVAALLRSTGAPVHVTRLLRERNFGVFEGKVWNEYLAAEKASGQDRYNYRPQGGENFHDVRKRVADVLSQVFGRHQTGTILLCSHTGFIRCLVFYLMGWPTHDFATYEIPNTALQQFLFTSRGELLRAELEICRDGMALQQPVTASAGV